MLAAIHLAAQTKLNIIYQKKTEIWDDMNSAVINKSDSSLYCLNITKTASEYFLITENHKEKSEESLPPNFLYKNLETRSYTQKTDSGEFVTGTLEELDWELKLETKKILGYTVKKAVLNMANDKQVTAWYSNLGYANGPEFYQNLPGLILQLEIKEKVNSQLRKTTFNAIAVNLSKNSKTIKDPAKL